MKVVVVVVVEVVVVMVEVVVVVVVVQTGDVRVLLQDIRTKDKTNQTPLVEINVRGRS